ncbi:hypothetical protein SARC_18247, partial [Sphaeroforma arctica JP610]
PKHTAGDSQPQLAGRCVLGSGAGVGGAGGTGTATERQEQTHYRRDSRHCVCLCGGCAW